MGDALCYEVWTRQTSQRQQAVLLVLAALADDQTGAGFVRVSKIVWLTGFPERRVKRVLETLSFPLQCLSFSYREESGVIDYSLNLVKLKPKTTFA